MDASAGESAILDVLQRGAHARFATEVHAVLRPRLDPATFDAALDRLAAAGRVVVVAKAAPDPHLADVDLRIIVQARPDAGAAIDAAWRDFLREFLSAHRCS